MKLRAYHIGWLGRPGLELEPRSLSWLFESGRSAYRRLGTGELGQASGPSALR